MTSFDVQRTTNLGQESGALVSAALDYAAQGLRVFPLAERGKAPLTSNGFKAATTDPDVIRRWWGRWPNANVGGGVPAGHLVIDADDHKVPGALEALEDRLGPLPETPTVETGGGGRHLWFTVPDLAFRAPGRGIDLRCAGKGYVVMPPSVHSSGRPYLWRGGEDETAEASPLPPAWVDELASTRPQSSRTGELPGDLRAILDGPAGWSTVERFLDALPQGPMDAEMSRALGFPTLADRMRTGAHETLVSVSYRVVATGVEGHSGALVAIGHLIAAFYTEQHRRAMCGEPCRSADAAETETARALIGAVMKIGGLS
ncbi:bifunctional DNA primase/polymerase [Nocardia takedensis]|uniref:bifunctional DNA primase/polymerase n=1 Tax=Nocardia takedensis TaxID=259390 RepID=UPI0002FB1BE0|nr:bifunctional DNA primase/polymerase [Nocardia takedensis]